MLDLKRFIPGRELLPGTLWVAEQIPGLIEAADMTETLLRGYWPSYNVPVFAEVCSPFVRMRDEAAELSIMQRRGIDSCVWLAKPEVRTCRSGKHGCRWA